MVCPKCDGFKTVAQGFATVECPVCHGTGEVEIAPGLDP